jgi:hypothetical protein
VNRSINDPAICFDAGRDRCFLEPRAIENAYGLPSEGSVERENNGLGRCLGKTSSIDLQSISAETPKQFSVVERDDGMFAIGWHDGAAGPFESRTFAQAVAAKGEGRHAPAT